MTSMTPAERAAWDAIGRDQTKWTAVKRALAAARPYVALEVADEVALFSAEAQLCDATECSVAGIQAAANFIYRSARGASIEESAS